MVKLKRYKIVARKQLKEGRRKVFSEPFILARFSTKNKARQHLMRHGYATIGDDVYRKYSNNTSYLASIIKEEITDE